jgi:hypothetical protein
VLAVPQRQARRQIPQRHRDVVVGAQQQGVFRERVRHELPQPS